jgi:hypothetical protein
MMRKMLWRMMDMAHLLRQAIYQKKEFLRTKLMLSEFYRGRGEQLADYTLSELEKEYESLRKMKKEM